MFCGGFRGEHESGSGMIYRKGIMATRYMVTWSEDGLPRSRGCAFSASAVPLFMGLVELEREGGTVSDARIEYLGPNGERFDEKKGVDR